MNKNIINNLNVENIINKISNIQAENYPIL